MVRGPSLVPLRLRPLLCTDLIDAKIREYDDVVLLLEDDRRIGENEVVEVIPLLAEECHGG
ncbi:hypothetical protein [Streptomyces sp. NPDC059957]|uniref:hypothetical protein n=1 Tax=unclassified Streptomyces TaxID=2593676 RepID=UPI003659A9AC